MAEGRAGDRQLQSGSVPTPERSREKRRPWGHQPPRGADSRSEAGEAPPAPPRSHANQTAPKRRAKGRQEAGRARRGSETEVTGTRQDEASPFTGSPELTAAGYPRPSIAGRSWPGSMSPRCGGKAQPSTDDSETPPPQACRQQRGCSHKHGRQQGLFHPSGQHSPWRLSLAPPGGIYSTGPFPGETEARGSDGAQLSSCSMPALLPTQMLSLWRRSQA